MSTCDVCGFDRDALTSLEIPDRLASATAEFIDVLNDAGSLVDIRPSSERWSILEYAAHLRDVFIATRERIITASILDVPTGTPIYRDERVSLGFYSNDAPEEVADELNVTSNLFIRTFRSLPHDFEKRELVFSPAMPVRVSLRWVGAQAVHECEHHLDDIRENLILLND